MVCWPLQTETGTVRIITRCGRFSRVAEPGCSILWCPCACADGVAGEVSTRVTQLQLTCNTKTLDNVFVSITVAVQYRAIAGRENDAFYKLTNPKHQIECYVFDSVRSEVPKSTLDDLFVIKEKLSRAIENQVKDHMSAFGFEVLATPITDIDPDAGVKHAMNEINRMERLKKAAEDKGEAEKILVIKQAESKAAQIRIESKADADAKQLQGEGLSRQRQAIVDGLKKSVRMFTDKSEDGVDGVDAKTVMEMILITQYFDMMKDIGASSKATTVFIPHNPSSVSELSSQLRQGIMEANTVTSEPQ